jgi:predicted MFS family arabinose efflux permease
LQGRRRTASDKRKVIGLSLLLQTLCLAAFGVWSATAVQSAGPVYLLLFIIGAARAFSSPALSAMLPRVVSDDGFPRAVAATSSVFQVCTIAGPAIGGLIYAVSGPATFAAASVLYFLAAAETLRLARAGPTIIGVT